MSRYSRVEYHNHRKEGDTQQVGLKMPQMQTTGAHSFTRSLTLTRHMLSLLAPVHYIHHLHNPALRLTKWSRDARRGIPLIRDRCRKQQTRQTDQTARPTTRLSDPVSRFPLRRREGSLGSGGGGTQLDLGRRPEVQEQYSPSRTQLHLPPPANRSGWQASGAKASLPGMALSRR